MTHSKTKSTKNDPIQMTFIRSIPKLLDKAVSAKENQFIIQLIVKHNKETYFL